MGTLEVRSLSRIRDGVLLFDEVSFIVPDGHAAALVGPAHAGKTALMRVIAGIDGSDAGDVLLDGQSLLRLPPERRRVGFLFDGLALFDDMTVRENVAFGLRMQRRARVDSLRRTDEVIEALGLGAQAQQKPRDLGPAARKRVAFARAIAPEPALLLLDEPTFGVEEVGRETWRQELAQALRTLGVTTLVATTDLRDAVTLAEDLVLMAEGQVIQTGTVSRVLQGPISIEAATLTGYVPLVRGDVADGFVQEAGVGSVAFPSGFPLRQHATVMAHPTALFGVPGGSGLGSGVAGTLLRARSDGPVYVVDVQLNDRTVALRWEWDLVPPPPGTAVEIAVRPGTLRFFNDTPAPRVRSAEPSTLLDPERSASLGGGDAEARAAAQTSTPLPEPGGFVETDRETLEAGVEAAAAIDEAVAIEVSAPEEPKPGGDWLQAEIPVTPVMAEMPEPDAPASEAPAYEGVILPMRPELRNRADGLRLADETSGPEAEPIRPRLPRPTLLQPHREADPEAPIELQLDASVEVDVEDAHDRPYDPAAAPPPPRRAAEGHSGMPLD